MARPYVFINVAASVDGKIDTVERRGASISSEADRERVDQLRASVDSVMGKLGELGFQRVMVEGGGSLNFELLRLGLVDEVQLFISPLIFGGATAPTLADGAGLQREAAIKLGRPRVETWEDGGVLVRY